MYVLGIGGLGYKDSAAALLEDGRPVAAVAEARFTGIKHEGGWPHRGVRYCLEQAGISMPDEAREVVFPSGVPVSMVDSESHRRPEPREQPPPATDEDETLAHSAEGDLASEADEIEQQARRSRAPEAGQDLLE